MDLQIPQLRLLHHFTTVTARTLAHDPEAEDVLSTYIVKVAFDFPFLLHSILALAALHLGQLHPNFRTEYVLDASRHHHAALTRFRNEVKDIDEDNLAAVLSFSSTIFAYSWAISTATSNDLEHAFGSILSNLHLTRRVRPLVQKSGLFDAMRRSQLGRIMPKDVHVIDWHKPERPEHTELVQLRKFSEIIHHVYPLDIIEAYKDAIIFLEALFDAVGRLTNAPSDSLLKSWLYHISPRFVELLSDKQPGALIVFAHYGVLLGRNRRYWFLENVNELMLKIADYFVPTEWKAWLDWPREEIQRARNMVGVSS
ncbi:hypothetical protein P280DRAFT_396678 [Massarina eburnea CBS 473.64]|uniref:C6 zinc finger domain-containing protein n=1 Tax=Massarina eburnea CBS 473.64 TaxID=1395130 RepID=A0A6A6S2H6_9PLEO|nr:hypothetical protein P280DRAFT_396678 [Massarina eburnea CBS 473.64]